MPWDWSYTKATYSIKDREDTQSDVSVNILKNSATVLDGTAVTDQLAKAAALRPAIDGVTEGKLERYSVNFRMVLTDPLVLAGDVEKKGLFLFQAANGLTYRSLIPGIRDSLLTSNRMDIDLLHASVLAFQNMMINGPFGAGNGPCTDAGASLTWIKQAYKQHRTSHTRRARKG